MNGQQLQGRTLTVNEAKPREDARGPAAVAAAVTAAVAAAAVATAAAAVAAAGGTNLGDSVL